VMCEGDGRQRGAGGRKGRDKQKRTDVGEA
jgi:hypothetical protein